MTFRRSFARLVTHAVRFGVAFCPLVACAPPHVVPVHRDRLVVATWNVRRLFDERCDSGRCGATEPEGIATPEEVEADVERVASAARGLDADVVVLEEVENDRLLERIARAYGGVVERAMGETPGDGTIDVAVLSRVPILSVRHHADVALVRADGRLVRPTRDLLEVSLAVVPRPVVVVAAHFKSQRNDDPERRLAEASFAGSLVDARSRRDRALVVLAGDLNDVPGSPPLLALEGADLFRVTSKLAPEDAYSIAYGASLELVDHLFVPARDAASACHVDVVRGASVGYGGSDHAAIRAAFVLEADTGSALPIEGSPLGTTASQPCAP